MSKSKHLRQIISLSLFAVVLALTTTLFWRVFAATLTPSDPAVARAFLGAFWGAFFAFLFIIASTFLFKWYDERVRSYMALVAAGHRVSNAASRMFDALNEVENLIEAFDGLTGRSGTAPLLSNRLLTIDVDPHAFIDLRHRDLLGELLQFTVDTRLLNDYIGLLNHSHDAVQQAAQSDALTPDHYRANLERMTPDLKKVRSTLQDRKLDAQRLLATIGVLSTRKPLLLRVTRWPSSAEYPDGFDDQVVSEMVRLQTDLVARQKSRKERDDRVRAAYEKALADVELQGPN